MHTSVFPMQWKAKMKSPWSNINHKIELITRDASSNYLWVRHFNFGVAWLSEALNVAKKHKFTLLDTAKLSDLQWVEDCKQILKSDGVLIDSHDAKHPGQAKQWQKNNHSFYTSPAGKQHNISCHNSIKNFKNVRSREADRRDNLGSKNCAFHPGYWTRVISIATGHFRKLTNSAR